MFVGVTCRQDLAKIAPLPAVVLRIGRQDVVPAPVRTDACRAGVILFQTFLLMIM